MVRGRQDDEMSHDDTEFYAAEKSVEFQRIKLINRMYGGGFRRVEDYLATLVPASQKKWRKILGMPPLPEEKDKK